MNVTETCITVTIYTSVLILYLYLYNEWHGALDKYPETTIQSFFILSKFRLFYFSRWNMVLQSCFLVVAILDEVTSLIHLSMKWLHLARHYLFAGVVFPCTLLVFCLFWAIFAVNKELIFPENTDHFLAPMVIFGSHMAIVLPVIVELTLLKGHDFHYLRFWSAFMLLTVYIAGYLIAYFGIFFFHDNWLHMLYEDMTWWQMIIFLTVLYNFSVLFLIIGICLQNWRTLPRNEVII